MNALPNQPFLSKDFSPRGGGIDFLGLRYVGLNILGRYLVPELNNVTQDMGTFFLGAWIPWKFEKLCNREIYTEKSYKAFRESIEVAISLNMSHDFSGPLKFGPVRNRIGITQDPKLPGELTFKKAQRNTNNSIFAAAMYGPALRALGLIESYRVAGEKPDSSLNIALAAKDPDTIGMAEAIDKSLQNSRAKHFINSLNGGKLSQKQIDDLGIYGLCPSIFRDQKFEKLHRSFEKKLLPNEKNAPGYGRTLTARLLIETLRTHKELTCDQIRDVWYTGMYEDGNRLTLQDEELKKHMKTWSFLMARQYQRYPLELFLWCFEDALRNGCRSIEDVIEYWSERTQSAAGSLNGTFLDLLHSASEGYSGSSDLKISETWNNQVSGTHEKFEYQRSSQDDSACMQGLQMLAGWYWRMLSRNETVSKESVELVTLGGSDRMSMRWFLNWISQRKDFKTEDFLKDVFSDLIFSQHMRVALARFDGTSQRLRFVLGDNGIEPTISAKKDIGRRGIPWMRDRLDMLVYLLCDIDVTETNSKGQLSIKRDLTESSD
jgi:hypothetical protein